VHGDDHGRGGLDVGHGHFIHHTAPAEYVEEVRAFGSRCRGESAERPWRRPKT
jgi:hypothetical protein